MLSIAQERIAVARQTEETRLDLSNLELRKLPPEILDLRHITELNLSRNPLHSFPSELLQTPQLTALHLTETGLQSLPTAIASLRNLRELYIANNSLRGLPQTLGYLRQLRTLDVSSNRFSTFPRALRHVTRLQSLDISRNNISELPKWIGELAELLRLSVSYTQVTHLPDSISELQNLVALTAIGTEFRAVPEILRSVKSLNSLAIANSRLTELPRWIGELEQLSFLSFFRNEISELPDSICRLTRLNHLDLETNRLRHLPNAFGDLQQLNHLDLTDNDLLELPESIRELTGLVTLYLQGNPALNVPVEVLGGGWEDTADLTADPKDILDYYFRIKGAERPLNEAKLILVGRGGVGKTSIVNQLVEGVFHPDEQKTEGISITEWPVQLNDSEHVRLHIWDFGGQEIMHATHQFFLTQRSIYLLVLNGRGGGEDADAEYWLKLIESFGGDSPVLIVLNKCEEHGFDLNRRAIQTKYPVRGFVRTDCQTGKGIETLRHLIEIETDRLDHLRDPFPASWFAIKNQLSGMRNNYLSFNEFRQFCIRHGESDAASQEALAGYLHTLGIVLNYRDDPRLQDTHVLNPHWVTNGIYKILNSPILEENKGEIRLTEIAQMLPDPEYPAHMRRFILDLMKKFDLCFSFPDDDTHYLIPELLDKQEPDATAEFNAAQGLNFRYEYPVLPEGLLPRFIVRTHVLSTRLPRWRTGVMLAFEGNRALVKADLQERTVDVCVTGPTGGRRRLLAVIRSDFERIHGDIPHLNPKPVIPFPEYPSSSIAYEDLVILEQQGIRNIPTVINGKVVHADVNDLLNGVDLTRTRDRGKEMTTEAKPIRIFYSYSHRDEALRKELENHLKLLKRRGMIDAWTDRDIEAGEEWRSRISDSMERADIILLLVSSDFISSDYCYEIEMTRALERHNSGEAQVIPIIIRDVNWTGAPFAKLQALPRDGIAVTLWPDRDSAWRDVAEGLERVIGTLRRDSGR